VPAEALLRLPLRLTVLPEFDLRTARLPAPWHLALGLLSASGLSLRARLACMRFVGWARRNRFRLAHDGTVAALLAAQRQDPNAIRYLWEPLCVAALNTPVSEASAQVFLHVLRDGLLGMRAASDLLLPIPSTAIMAALGLVYGPIWGGLIGTAGSFLGGALGYGLCRWFGRPLALRILGPDGLVQGERLFARAGGWLVALSRWLPILPEVIACMAGVTRMPVWAFVAALLCGAAPMAFTFAAIGHLGGDHPVLAIVLSALAPPLLWLLVGNYVRRA